MSSPEAMPPKPQEQVPPPASQIEELKFEAGIATRERHHQDAYFSLPEKGIFGIFDGVSGEKGGAASANARDLISDLLSKLPPDLPEEEWENNLIEALKKADEFIRGEGGTTALVAKIIKTKEDKRKLIIAHVGDSRAYLQRGDNELKQLTIDDNLMKHDLTEMKREREIETMQKKLNNALKKEELTTEEYAFYYLRDQISQALGGVCQPSSSIVELENGDVLLLSTDGLHGNLTDSRPDGLTPSIEDLLKTKARAQEKANALAQAAYERSKLGGFRGKPDDITAVVVTLL